MGDVRAVQRAGGADLFGSRQGEAAGEHRKPREQLSLLLTEQAVAPVERRLERAMPGKCGSGATGQEAEAVVQPSHDLLYGQGRHTAGCQLDGQRHAVKAPAQEPDALGVVAVEPEVGLSPGRALQEHGDGCMSLHLTR
jgi:hypothetical protein